MNVPVKPIDSWSSRRLPRKQRQHECSSKANRQLVKRTQIPRKQRQHESSSKANRQLVKRNSPLLGNSVSMNLPVKPIDSWSRGIRRLLNSVSMNLPVKPIDSWSRGIRRRLLVEPTFESLYPTFHSKWDFPLIILGKYRRATLLIDTGGRRVEELISQLNDAQGDLADQRDAIKNLVIERDNLRISVSKLEFLAAQQRLREIPLREENARLEARITELQLEFSIMASQIKKLVSHFPEIFSSFTLIFICIKLCFCFPGYSLYS
ncbi:unnamed protein product [Protopolystoma xenopodis]|uniref:Uncharacterized protein n=1 Tax=Protopolystoma xenopodis TaxID=117903 RepID=A0A448WWU6_9PLAT|nr:unnamed protein product [Protopolystoma xenopodis]